MLGIFLAVVSCDGCNKKSTGKIGGPKGKIGGPKGKTDGPKGKIGGPKGKTDEPKGKIGGPKGKTNESKGKIEAILKELVEAEKPLVRKVESLTPGVLIKLSSYFQIFENGLKYMGNKQNRQAWLDVFEKGLTKVFPNGLPDDGKFKDLLNLRLQYYKQAAEVE